MLKLPTCHARALCPCPCPSSSPCRSRSPDPCPGPEICSAAAPATCSCCVVAPDSAPRYIDRILDVKTDKKIDKNTRMVIVM